MSKIHFTALALALTALGTPAFASKRAAKNALEEVQDLLKELDDQDRTCRRAVQSALSDAVDDLEDLADRFSERKASRVARLLSRAARDASDDCSRRFAKSLKRTARDLEELVEDDRRGSGKRRRKRTKCWNARDPGCDATRNGEGPMSNAAFNSLLTAVKAAKPHVYPMLDVLQPSVANQYMTSMQLSILVREFKPHIYPMQDVVKACAPRLVDPQNGGVVTEQFRPHVFPMQDVAKLIGAQTAD